MCRTEFGPPTERPRCCRTCSLCGLLPAVHAELPGGFELAAAARAVLCGQILTAVWAVDHGTPDGQRAAAELAPHLRVNRCDSRDLEGCALAISALPRRHRPA